jgi:hypothetical protein
MKTNPTIFADFWVSMVLKTLCVLAVMAMAVLVLGAWTYEKEEREITRAARDDAFTEKLLNLTTDNGLLREISQGHAETARETLSTRMTDAFATLGPDMTTADEADRSFAKIISLYILKQERAQPDLYLSSLPDLRRFQADAWERARRQFLESNEPARYQDPPVLFGISQKFLNPKSIINASHL